LILGFLVHQGATINCPHPSGTWQPQIITSNTKVFVSGMAVATQDDNFPIQGCLNPLPAPGSPPASSACDSIKWTKPASHVLVNNHYAILQDSVGISYNKSTPQGAPIVATTQKRVTGT
jgi:hypothetical protein